MKRIIVIGGGFAGLWSAVSAARQLDVLGDSVQILLVNRDRWHSIRVRNYEADLTATRIDLASLLDPVGVKLVIGEVTDIDTQKRIVNLDSAGKTVGLRYDKLILASGSHLVCPPTPGMAQYSFNVDTYAAAIKLQEHISGLASGGSRPGRFTAIVIGSGATGVELACELPERLRAAALASGHGAALEQVRVILADRSSQIAQRLGGARAVIENACRDLGVELMPNLQIESMDANGVTLTNGSRLDAAIVVCCAGMKASGLTARIDGYRDNSGRLKTDKRMRVIGVDHVYAAGDVAHALIDGERPSVMSCQHARPMGRFAGHNAVNELFNLPTLALNIDWYTNIIDLGPWGAVYTQGWERVAVAEGQEAKKTKTLINRERIYPPREGGRLQLFHAASLEVQRPPVLKPLGESNADTHAPAVRKERPASLKET